MSNVINVRKLIKNTCKVNCSPSAASKLKERLESYGKELIEKAFLKVEARKQKTLKGSDFEEEQ